MLLRDRQRTDYIDSSGFVKLDDLIIPASECSIFVSLPAGFKTGDTAAKTGMTILSSLGFFVATISGFIQPLFRNKVILMLLKPVEF